MLSADQYLASDWMGWIYFVNLRYYIYNMRQILLDFFYTTYHTTQPSKEGKRQLSAFIHKLRLQDIEYLLTSQPIPFIMMPARNTKDNSKKL